MATRPIELGLVLPLLDDPRSGASFSWDAIRSQARFAEVAGFDTVWIPDELVWAVPSWPGPRGWWECVAIAGAVSAVTDRVNVGTWVLSALHRNPGLTASVAETLDEVSGGRLILGIGSGHAGTQGEMFGYPPDRTVGRYEEALTIMMSLLRTGRADHDGEFHSAKDQLLMPRGPRSGEIPVMLGGHRPRTIGLAVRHADIWSAYATDSSLPEAFVDRLALVDRICEEQGRDPASLRRSVGLVVEPGDAHVSEEVDFGIPLSGSTDRIADAIHRFADMGVDMVEFMPMPNTDATLEALAAVVAALDT